MDVSANWINTKCSVTNCPNFPGCSSRSITFFSFPTEPDRRKKWIELLEISPETFSCSLHNVVCQDHFQADQFKNAQNTRLISAALPFSPSDPIPIEIKYEEASVQEVETFPDDSIGNIQIPMQRDDKVTSVSRALEVGPVPEDFARAFPNINVLLMKPKKEGVTSSSSSFQAIPPSCIQTASQIVAEQRRMAKLREEIEASEVENYVRQPQVKMQRLSAEEIEAAISKPKVESPPNEQKLKTKVKHLSMKLPKRTTTKQKKSERGLKRKLDENETNLSSLNENIFAESTELIEEECIMCNADMKINDRTDHQLHEESQIIIRTFLKLISIYPIGEEDSFEKIPFCICCLRKVGRLVEIHDKILDLQVEFRFLQTEVTQSLMTAFHQRKEKAGIAKEHYEYSHKPYDMTDKLFEPVRGNTVSKKSRLESPFKFDTSIEDIPRFFPKEESAPVEAEAEMKMDEDDHEWNFTNDDGSDFEFQNENTDETHLQSEATSIPARTMKFDPLNLPDNIGEVVEICFGKQKTSATSRWEALMSCPETAIGLEKVVPIQFRRVTCPICQKKISPNKVPIHLHLHSKRVDRMTLDFIKQKLLATSTVLLERLEYRRTMTKKWKILEKYKYDNGISEAIPIPRKFQRSPCRFCGKLLRPEVMRSHLHSHQGVRPFICEICGMAFTWSGELSAHRRKIHVEPKPKNLSYFCDFCEGGKFQVFRTAYVNHILSEHSSSIGSQEVLSFYNCDDPDCRKCFRHKDNLLEHLKSHSDSDSDCVHSCQLCDKVFCNQENYDKHISNLHGSNVLFDCKYCPEFFESEKELSDHESRHIIRMSEETREYLCEDCGKGFKTDFNLKIHRYWHANRSKLLDPSKVKTSIRRRKAPNNSTRTRWKYCHLCKKFFYGDSRLTYHLLNVHTYEKRLECYMCKHPFRLLELLEKHIKLYPEPHKRIGKGKYSFNVKPKPPKPSKPPKIVRARLSGRNCHLCGKVNKSNRELRSHLLDVHTYENKLKCYVCDLPFKTLGSLKTHFYNHHIQSKQCPVCNKEFRKVEILTNHLLDIHTYENKLKCYICGHQFKAILKLECHIRQHLGKPRKTDKNPCPYCQSLLPSFIKMREHCVRNHPQEYLADKPYYCPICFSKFASEEESVDHYNKMHERFRCKECGKQFANKYRFESHSRIHTGERPFKCTMCEKSFTSVSNWKEHEMRHKGEKPFKCQICSEGVGFYRKKLLKTHMETVHGGNDDEETNGQISASGTKRSKMKLRPRSKPQSKKQQQVEMELELEVINVSDAELSSNFELGTESEFEDQ